MVIRIMSETSCLEPSHQSPQPSARLDIERSTRHLLLAIVPMTLCFACSGGDALVEIEESGNATCKEVAAFLALPNSFFTNG